MGHTRLKRKKKGWTTQKKWRGGNTITKTKQVQQSFDTIHDFYSLERGLFKTGLDSNVSTLQRAYDTMVAANPHDPQIAQAQADLQQAQNRAKLYETMKKVMQYMIITLNSVTFNIPILQTIHTPQSINGDIQFSKYTGNKKSGQLFFAGPNIPSSKVSTSGIEIQGREYFEIPPGREWPKLADAATSYINLASLLFNLNDNPDRDTQNAYNLALGQPIGTPISQAARLTGAHTIYMVCDAGANTYGILAESVRAKSPNGKTKWDGTLIGPRLMELVTPLTTADSASSNPYQDHEFVFVASGADPDVFISDANLYTNDIYQIQYVRDQWNAATGLGFKLVISRLGSNQVLFEVVYGILGEGQTPSVKPAGSRALPSIYNSQGPSAASLSGCALLRALNTASVAPGAAAPAGVFPDIDDEKIGKPPIVDPLTSRSPQRVRDMVAGTPIPGGATLREQIIHELMEIMTQQNGVSPLCGTANMVDMYNLCGPTFSNLPPEVWFDSKRGGDRDQVKALHMLSQQRDVSDNLVYPFIHFVTGDELAAKMAVELGLAVIYQANGIIRYWPKMFRFRPESRNDALLSFRITTAPAPEATQGPWAIALWGGNQMKGGLRNPISEHISLPPYAKLEDKDGVQYIIIIRNGSFLSSQNQVILPGKDGRPHIIISDLWFNPSKYVMMKEQITPLVMTTLQIISVIKTQYDTIKQHIPQISEFPNRVSVLIERADELSNIDYRPLPPDIRQAIINVLQGISILKQDNRGIYQYEFINAVRFNNDPRINELDELTFRIVNESKEDDGLDGAALIGQNSPAVTVIPDVGLEGVALIGQHSPVRPAPWTIPALIDTDLLEYDSTFMSKQFVITLVQYFINQGFTKEEIYSITILDSPFMLATRSFIVNYGIKPIASYIWAKYNSHFRIDGFEQAIESLINKTFSQLFSPNPPIATGTFKRRTPISVKGKTMPSALLSVSPANSVQATQRLTPKQQSQINSNIARGKRLNVQFSERNAKRRESVAAKRGTPSLFRAPSLLVSQGGHTQKKRRTQKNHKRKRHGTQQKRSHKGSMRHPKDKGSKSTSQ